jgi:Txe/YoeB family toxin of toxin-antitoxin system
MSRIVVFHPKPTEVASGVASLRKSPPHVFVIDLVRQPSQGRALAAALRQLKATRSVPLVSIEGALEKTDRVKADLPDATYTTWRGVRGAVRRASHPSPGPPVVPDPMAGYSGTPLPKKLGIKAHSVVALLGAPEDFEGKPRAWLPTSARSRSGPGASRPGSWTTRSRPSTPRGPASASPDGRRRVNERRSLGEASGSAIWKFLSGRALDLVGAILRDPFTGIGKPEPLKYLSSGTWSRRLTQEHRIVHLVRGDRINFPQARYHYCNESVACLPTRVRRW